MPKSETEPRRLRSGVFAALLFFVPPLAKFDIPREIQHLPGNAQTKSITIVTWNIDHGSNLAEIGNQLQRSGADLCLLQEVDSDAKRSAFKDVTAELAQRLNMNAAFGIEFEELSQAKESGAPAYIGQATLTRLPLAKPRVLRFSRQSTFWRPHSWLPSSLPLMQRRLGNRIALVTELQFAGQLLVVYNPHLESRSAGAIQAAQMDEILADLGHYPAGTNAMIAGDMNSKYFPSLFLRRMQKAGFHSALGERVERTHRIAMALDWIFVRGPFTLQEGSVRHDMPGSDHYPIAARLIAQP